MIFMIGLIIIYPIHHYPTFASWAPSPTTELQPDKDEPWLPQGFLFLLYIYIYIYIYIKNIFIYLYIIYII